MKLPEERKGLVDLYGSNYARFDSPLYEEIRREAFGEDLGSNSWLTPLELETILARLGLGPASRVLDVGCGAGGIAIRLARRTGCEVVGIDLHEQAIENARATATRAGLAERARFETHDAGGPLPFPPGSFDAIVCIDTVNHLPDRRSVLAEWRRLLRPDGRLLFTDPVVLTGLVSEEETAARGSIGFYLFLPDGENEKMLAEAGLDLVTKEDATDNVVRVARRRREAREARAGELRRVEGDATFEGQQKFLLACESLARDRRLSRFLYLAQMAGKGRERDRAR